MPREDIRSVGSDNTVVRVGWSPETGDVQIATLNMDVYTQDLHSPAGGWFLNLDRRGLNELIRVARRARDAAFGKDE